jgi:iron-sulfur cluster repair protein YtfE (RIC family)
MTAAEEDRAQAATLPEGDVIRVLLEQHARIHELFAAVKSASGERKQDLFDQLRELLAVHEVGEEMVLRPVTRETAGASVVDARLKEESDASHALADLEKMDVSTAEFDRALAALAQSVAAHAEHEEAQEFPTLQTGRDGQERYELGAKLLAAEKRAPTHPHPMAAGSPTAVKTVGPFAALMDKARDSFKD